MEDRDKDPTVVLPYLVGRPLVATEVYAAFGYHKSAFYKAAREGRLLTAANLIKVAGYFGLNPIDLEVRFGFIKPEAVTDYLASAAYESSLNTSTPEKPRLGDFVLDRTSPSV